jgi:hypothetical protein
VLGRIAPDISRIRITNTADNVVVWDVKPLSNESECWNNCWNLKFQIGSNQSSFTAGHQVFAAEIPQAPTFLLRKALSISSRYGTAKGAWHQSAFDCNRRLARARFAKSIREKVEIRFSGIAA